MKITCELCKQKLRKDKALMDEKWEVFGGNNTKEVYLCRECVKLVAERVFDEY